MRLQLALAGLLVAGVAHADGTLSLRGVYYKERSTRVMQPMLDGMFEAGARGVVRGHLLVDAITSASASSGAAAAEPFTERRVEGGIGYAHELSGPDDSYLDLVRLGGDLKYSSEPDYRSFYVGGRVEVEVAQKNALLSVGGGIVLDNMDASGSQDSGGISEGIKLMCPGDLMAVSSDCDLNTYALFTSFSHVLGKNAVLGLSYDLAYSDGYHSNPYRQVIISPSVSPERHPFTRTRQAFAVVGRYYVQPTRTTVIGAYRYYFDDWDIHAHTPEVRIVQEVGRSIDAGFRYRYYTQDASFFHEPRYMDPNARYVTDDPKMSAFDGHLIEAKLGILGEAFGFEGRWAATRFEGILEFINQQNRFGNAVVGHASITVPFDY